MRQCLPATRKGQTHKIDLADKVTLHVTVNRDENGNIMEVFAKADQGFNGDADGLGELSSLLLQYGCPVDKLVQHLRYRRYEPSGCIGQPCSISDAIGMVLEDEQTEMEKGGGVMDGVSAKVLQVQ